MVGGATCLAISAPPAPGLVAGNCWPSRSVSRSWLAHRGAREQIRHPRGPLARDRRSKSIAMSNRDYLTKWTARHQRHPRFAEDALHSRYLMTSSTRVSRVGCTSRSGALGALSLLRYFLSFFSLSARYSGCALSHAL